MRKLRAVASLTNHHDSGVVHTLSKNSHSESEPTSARYRCPLSGQGLCRTDLELTWLDNTVELCVAKKISYMWSQRALHKGRVHTSAPEGFPFPSGMLFARKHWHRKHRPEFDIPRGSVQELGFCQEPEDNSRGRPGTSSSPAAKRLGNTEIVWAVPAMYWGGSRAAS